MGDEFPFSFDVVVNMYSRYGSPRRQHYILSDRHDILSDFEIEADQDRLPRWLTLRPCTRFRSTYPLDAKRVD